MSRRSRSTGQRGLPPAGGAETGCGHSASRDLDDPSRASYWAGGEGLHPLLAAGRSGFWLQGLTRPHLTRGWLHSVRPDVHHVECAGLEAQQVQYVHVVQLAVADVDEGRDGAAQVKQRVRPPWWSEKAPSRTGSGTDRWCWSPVHKTALSRRLTPSESMAYSLRARRINTAARSDQMRQSRDSLASASVERLTVERKPIAYSLPALADRLASMSRRLSLQVSWATTSRSSSARCGDAPERSNSSWPDCFRQRARRHDTRTAAAPTRDPALPDAPGHCLGVCDRIAAMWTSQGCTRCIRPVPRSSPFCSVPPANQGLQRRR